MSYRPYNRNVSGIFYLGDQGADAPLQTTSDIIISDGGGANTYIQSANLVVADGGNIGSATSKDAISIASNGNVTFDQSVSISQNLTVNGTLTTIATEYFTVQDPLIYLGSGNGADVNDLGFFGEYSDDGGTTPEYAGLFRDATDEKFRLFHSLEEEPSTTVNTGGTGYTVATLVANLEGDVTGDVTGNADTATEATNVTLTANQTTNETVYLTFADGATGTQGLETDTALNYNPSTDTLTAGTLAGNVTGDLTGNADTATQLETARGFSITGEGNAASVNFDGTGPVALSFGLDETAISNQTAKGAAAVGADVLLILDSQDGNSFKKITRTNFISGLGGFNNFVVTDSGNAQNTIGDGAELEFQDGDTITFTVFNTNPFGVYVSGNIPDQGVTETQLNASVAGLGIAGGAGTALSFDPSELTAAAIANGDSLVFMDNSDGNAPKVEGIADVATLFAGDGLTASASVMAVNTGAGLEISSDAVRIATSAAGNGLSGGGGSALAVDLSELSAGSAVGSGDLLAGYDGTNSVTWTISQIGSWLAGDNITVSGDGRLSAASSTTFTVDGDSGSAQTISDGDTLQLTGGTGINTVASATDTITYNLDLGSLNGTETTLQIGDSIAFVDNSDSSASKRITFANFSNNLAGDGLTNGGGAAALDVNAGAGLEVVSDAVRIATSAAGDGLTGGGGSALAVNTGAGLEIDSDAVRIATTAAGNGLSGGGGSALALDINGLTAATFAGGDAIVFNDADDSNTAKKILWTTAVQGIAGVGLSSSVGVLALDFTELTNQTAVTSGDIFVGVRGTDESQWTIDEMATRLAGPGIAVSGDGIMTVTGGDFSGATLENITATDTMLYVDAGDSETKRSSLTALADILTDGSNSALRNDGADIFVDISSLSAVTPEWKDLVLFEDGNVANLNQRCTWADIAAEMAGDGLTVDASTMSLDVEVDDSTIEIATDTVQVKDGGITFAKMEAATIVTEAEGIDNNDNDTTLPTSAAVKDYVDNLSGLSVVTQTSASLTVTTEDVVLCDTSSNNITVTLPENGGDVGSGRRVTVKKTTSDSATVTISRQTADTIDGATTYVLYSDNESASFVCDGSNWFIV